jgi:hypothetical protein
MCATKYQNVELKETDIFLTKWKLSHQSCRLQPLMSVLTALKSAQSLL